MTCTTPHSMHFHNDVGGCCGTCHTPRPEPTPEQQLEACIENYNQCVGAAGRQQLRVLAGARGAKARVQFWTQRAREEEDDIAYWRAVIAGTQSLG